ncbi:MAG: hypothetical protein KAX18_09840 [Candidatus Lokiarchaeota archaeon]|nr:hypothetical protein [Candidatus Lokiarchaeota archaeon]
MVQIQWSIMLETYTDFMIFEVKDNGEYSRLNITEGRFRQNNGNSVLQPSQTVIIVKEELRRIYLWKGISSSVRRKFIASRVASEIQRELMNSSSFHRCKIVSIDQGDEPNEFLNTFGFQKIPITIDNDMPIFLKTTNTENTLQSESKYIKNWQVKYKENKDFTNIAKKIPSYENLKKNQKTQEVLEKVLKTNTPDNYTRKNILVGNNILYGEIIKKADVFNNRFEEKGWEVISSFPREVVEIEESKLRIHINKELGEIEAIEILEKTHTSKKLEERLKDINFEKWTVKQLKQFCRENNVKVPSSYRKAEIVHLVMEINAPL